MPQAQAPEAPRVGLMSLPGYVARSIIKALTAFDTVVDGTAELADVYYMHCHSTKLSTKLELDADIKKLEASLK